MKQFIIKKDSEVENNIQKTYLTKEKSPVPQKKLIYFLFFLLIGIASVMGYFAFKNYSDLQLIREEKDAELLKSRLGEIYILPDGDPLIASVNDVEKLRKEQPFYNKAENGDKIFIWGDKAVIYRPEEEKIVDFGIIINSTVTPTPTPKPTNTQISR